MSDTKLMRIMTFNARRAMLFGYKPTKTDRLIMLRSIGVHMQNQHTSRYGHKSFTSTLRHGANGCCFLSTKYSHEDYWDVVYLPVTEEEEAFIFNEECEMADVDGVQAYQWANGENSTYHDKDVIYGPDHVEYDLSGASFSYWTKFKIWKPSKTKMVCNRACTKAVLAGKPDAMDTVIQTHRGREHRQVDWASFTPSEADAMFRNYVERKQL